MFRIAMLTLLLSGCASLSPMHEYNTVLVNADGQEVECSFAGFGVMMGNQAYSNHQQCVANAQSRGFKTKDS